LSDREGERARCRGCEHRVNRHARAEHDTPLLLWVPDSIAGKIVTASLYRYIQKRKRKKKKKRNGKNIMFNHYEGDVDDDDDGEKKRERKECS